MNRFPVPALMLAAAGVLLVSGSSLAQPAPAIDAPAADIPRIISYQGLLTTHEGTAVRDGEYTVTVTLYADEGGTKAVWHDTYTTQVTGGVFSVGLGSGRAGLPTGSGMSAPLWVGLRLADGTEMRPLTRMTSAPYALNVADNAITSEKIAPGAVTVDKLDRSYISEIRVNGDKVAGQSESLNFIGAGVDYDRATGSVIIGSTSKETSSEKGGATAAGVGDQYWHIAGDGRVEGGAAIIYPTATDWIGTSDPPGIPTGNDFTIKVNGEKIMRYQPNLTNTPSVVGGHLANAVTPAGSTGSVIAGGGNLGSPNQIVSSSDYSVIGGGADNTAGTAAFGVTYSVIGGGENNSTGSGAFATTASTIGGGADNSATADHTTVGGGTNNTSSGQGATIGGGTSNVSSGSNSTVAGGEMNRAVTTNATVGGGGGNQATGDYSTIGGGSANFATMIHATVGGGRDNHADDAGATVGGGESNIALLNNSTVGGGMSNQAGGPWATVGGGASNQANGPHSTVSGGESNIIPAPHAFIGGGTDNHAGGPFSTIGGGMLNHANGPHATISGGLSNHVPAPNATVGGGWGNQGVGPYSFIGGGQNNHSPGGHSAVGGGMDNQTMGTFSAIGGGRQNTAGGPYSTISGGEGNHIIGSHAFIGGGFTNQSVGQYSVIGGGQDNRSPGIHSVVGGGFDNHANVAFSTVAGGTENENDGMQGTIGGGFNNTIAVGPTGTVPVNPTIAGGSLNLIEAPGASIGGGELHRIVLTAANDGSNATITGGEQNIAQSYGQTVAGVYNNNRGNIPYQGIHLPGTTTAQRDEPLFMVGNGDIPGGVRSNAFEVSYNGHSVVHDTKRATPGAAGRLPIKGATYTDNVLYAWGHVDVVGIVPNVVSEFGVLNVFRLAAGVYRVEIDVVDPYTGASIPFGGASVTATLVDNTSPSTPISCTTIKTSPVTYTGPSGPSSFVIKIADYAGSSCNMVDHPFMFKVTGRP